ncbi:MAG: Holliday junction resolvase RuvX [Acidobacteria bacterium]|nr:Holliday junction resolvase RuvX [Acidobacteriota bacterium]MBV9146477.1 Holliday junction resolvase RuvX [Acidobacteriota bacterium]
MERGQNRTSGRILGLDVGARRIGVAVSDPLGLTAQGLETIQRRNRRYDSGELQKVVSAHEIREIVVGNPLRMSGESGTQAEKMEAFAAQLRQTFAMPVHLWDERLTTAEAHRLLDETGIRDSRRKEVIDKMAAVLILQSFLDARRARTP